MDMPTFSDLLGQPEVRAYAPGETVFREDDPSDGRMYILIEGGLLAFRRGRELETLSEAGSVFGEIGLIDGLPRSATVRATAPTRVAVIDDETFRLLILRNPTFALEMMRLLTRRARSNLI